MKLFPGRSRSILALAALCFTSVESPAADRSVDERFHWGVDLGSSFVRSTHLVGYDDYESGRIKFDPGVRLDLAVGYDLIGTLAVGFETGFVGNQTELLTVGGWTTDAGLYQVPLLGTVTWRIPTGTKLHPFVGAAVGGVDTILIDYDFFSGSSDDDLGLAWQATAGCRYELSPRMELGIAYKYLGATERRFPELEAKLGSTHTHSITASFLMRF